MTGQRPESVPTVGRRRRGGSGAPPIWFGIPFALMGVIAIAIGFVLFQGEQQYGREGAMVEGTVLDKAYDPGDDEESPSYHLRYEFLDPATGQRHGGSGSVSAATYSSMRVGDTVHVTYLPADPGRNRLGSPEPQLLMPMMVMGIGAIFALAGPLLIATSLRARRLRARATATGTSTPGSATPGSAMTDPGAAGPVVPVSAEELRRVDVFTRSPIRVLVELVLAPLGGLGFLAFAAWGVTQIAVTPFFIVGAPMAAFFGLILLSTLRSALRRGVSSRVAEVGPDGVWTADLGRISWAGVAEVRLESMRGAGPTRRASGLRIRGAGLETVPRDVGTAMTYHRLGIVPRDPALTTRAPGGFARRLSSGFISLTNAIRSDASLTEPGEVAPFGINAYEIEQPFEDLVASVRRFIGVAEVSVATSVVMPREEGPSLGGWALSGVTPGPIDDAPHHVEAVRPEAPMTDADLRALDARLGGSSAAATPATALSSLVQAAAPAVPMSAIAAPAGVAHAGVAAIASAAPPLVERIPPSATRMHSEPQVFRRRGFSAGDALSLLMPGESTILPPALGVILTAVAGGAFVLIPPLAAISALGSAVGGTGGLGGALIPLAFAGVCVVVGLFILRAVPRRWSQATGDADLLTIAPSGLGVRGELLPWARIASVTSRNGRLEIALVDESGTPRHSLDFDLFEDDDDVILDAIARFRIVDEE
jgi:hypothetical protein